MAVENNSKLRLCFDDTPCHKTFACEKCEVLAPISDEPKEYPIPISI